jgi:hypothetical protein
MGMGRVMYGGLDRSHVLTVENLGSHVLMVENLHGKSLLNYFWCSIQ